MLEFIKFKLKCYEMKQKKDAYLHFQLNKKSNSVYLITQIVDSNQLESMHFKLDYASIDLLLDVLSRFISIDSFKIDDDDYSYYIQPYFLTEENYEKALDKLFYDFNITIEAKSSKSSTVKKSETLWINQSELYKTLKYIQKYIIENDHPDGDY